MEPICAAQPLLIEVLWLELTQGTPRSRPYIEKAFAIRINQGNHLGCMAFKIDDSARVYTDRLQLFYKKASVGIISNRANEGDPHPKGTKR